MNESLDGAGYQVDKALVRKINCYCCSIQGRISKSDDTVPDLLTIYLGAIHILNSNIAMTVEKRADWLRQKRIAEEALRKLVEKE